MSLDLFEVARRQPDALALIDGSERLSYAELARRSALAADALAARGVLDPSSAVGVVTRRTSKTLAVLLACFAHGVPVVCFGAGLPAAERARLAARAEVRVTLSPDDEAIDDGSAAATNVGQHEPRRIEPTAPLAIIPTSGTTGRPKLVVLSRSAFLASARASASNLPLSAGDRWLLCLPLAHVGGLSIVTRSLLAGSAVVLFEPSAKGLLAEIDALGHAIERSGATLVSLVPTLLHALLDAGFRSPRCLRAVLLGGAGASVELLERASASGFRVLPTYGLTEACSQVTTAAFDAPLHTLDGIVSAGRPLPGIELRIGEGERILVRGATLATSLLDEPLGLDREGWLVTDDVGRMNADGELFVRGRASDRIVTGGENVDPLPVEAALLSDPALASACVFGVPDPRFGEVVACALVARPGFNPANYPQALSAELAPFSRPRLVAMLAELPLTPSGKVDRAKARALATPLLSPWSELKLRSAGRPI